LARDPDRICGCEKLVEVVAGELHEQPAAPSGQFGHRCRATCRGNHVGDPTIEPFARNRGERQDVRDRVRGGDHVGEAQDDHDSVGRILDEPNVGLEDDTEGSLRADQRLGDVEALLGQQVLERVSGDLPAEPSELGPDRRQGTGDGVAQLIQRRGVRVLLRGEGPGADVLTGRGQQVEPPNVVTGAPVSQCAGTARVVADHSPDRAPGVR
jgi:hypothetical protein